MNISALPNQKFLFFSPPFSQRWHDGVNSLFPLSLFPSDKYLEHQRAVNRDEK